ncbi:acetyltransferase [Erythrobacter aurantius]|uniref:acetyltransferase n=1 Tax=Erythrobacter aurantius TaxID=2909249 RepID=UPI00207AA244|nr:acetyltransferase [Erythrobacter aurantius]
MNTRHLLGVYGAGGFGREVIPVLSQYAAQNHAPESWQTVFIDDAPAGSLVGKYQVMRLDEFARCEAASREAVLAVGSGAVRQVLADKCRAAGVPVGSLVAPNAMILDNVELGKGAVLCPFSMVTSDTRIGELFQANIYAYIAHDCVVGDRVTLAPGAKVNGNVHIADDVYIGTGAVIRPGKPGEPLIIGAGAVIGMGAVVTRNVPEGATVVGNPARVLGG